MNMPITIKLRSSDNKIFEVDMEVAKMFDMIRIMFQDCGMESNASAVQLPNINSMVFAKVLEYADYHKDDLPVEEDVYERRTDNICEWDQNFLEMDHGTLIEVIIAANFLQIKGLLDACCKTVANMIKGKTTDEIRETFNIEAPKPE